MSYESESILPETATLKEVIPFVEMLGYRREGRLPAEFTADFIHLYSYVYFDHADYHSFSGVELTITQKERESLRIYTRSTIGRSYYDLEQQNKTIRYIQQYFGGSFTTDEGKGRYQRPQAGPPSPAQAGCDLAFQRFGHNLVRADLYLAARAFGQPWDCLKEKWSFGIDINPRLLSNNMLLPYLFFVMEDYIKSTYIALLRYSDRKETILKGGRLSAEHLARISSGEMTVEEAFAEMLPF